MPARPATTDDLARLEDRLTRSRKDDLDALEGRLRRGWKADLERHATKEDLERFATKEDLERFATKEDLERFATKEDLERFATKEDLDDVKSELRGEMADMRTELIQHIADASVHTAEVVVSQMRVELARNTAASAEETRKLLRAFHDQFRDLPDRVAELRRDVDALRDERGE